MRDSQLLNSLVLAVELSRRDLFNRYAGSYAGLFWTIGVPLLYSLINVVVFSTLMSGRMGERYGDIPFALFFFVPFSLWILFSEVVGRSTTILKDYSYLVSKVAFPYWVLPLVPIASALLSQIIIVLLSCALIFYYDVSVGSSVFWYLAIWVLCLLMSIGVSYAVSALSAYIADMGQIVPILLNIIFWLTPILYPATLVEQGGMLWVRKIIMDWNPFYYISEYSRHAVFSSGVVEPLVILILLLLSVCMLGFGVFLFCRLKSGFADVL